jgi:hypothetical protein
MSKSNKVYIKDFSIFCQMVKSALKIVDSAKFIINNNGVSLYGARNRIARCELVSNAIYSDTQLEFSILELNAFNKVLQTIEQVHDGDFVDFNFTVEMPFVKFKSSKFKMKLITCDENVIQQWISKKVEVELTPIFEFTTNMDLIKRINNHSFIFQDVSTLRVYIEVNDDMENNTLFATLGNKDVNLNNEITLKFGLVTFGKLDKERRVIIDLERINLFNALPADEIKISLMDKNVLVSKTTINGKNDSYFTCTILNSILKN